MLGPLISTVRSFRLVASVGRWRRDLAFLWHTREKDNLVFFSVLVLLVVAFGSLLHVSNTERGRIHAERQRQHDLACLARNIYFEARGEPMAGQFAVAEVTMNRVASKHYPNTVCEVVHQRRWDRIRKRYVSAFSWTELDSVPEPKGEAWRRAVSAAEAVYDNREAPRVDGALFYHARSIRPRWAKRKKPVARIGRHVFYH